MRNRGSAKSFKRREREGGGGLQIVENPFAGRLYNRGPHGLRHTAGRILSTSGVAYTIKCR